MAARRVAALCTLWAVSSARGEAVSRVLGAPSSGPLAEAYASAAASGSFSCGSNVLPFAAVNDDFCDCEDGSDEPGTAACAGGVARRPARFLCRNEGPWDAEGATLAKEVPHSRVGDGVCDCCDGSDEEAGACGNSCDAEDHERRRSAKEREAAEGAGRQARQRLVEAARAKEEQLAAAVKNAEAQRDEAAAAEESAKAALDREEALEAQQRAAQEPEPRQDLAEAQAALGIDSWEASDLAPLVLKLVDAGDARLELEYLLEELGLSLPRADDAEGTGADEYGDVPEVPLESLRPTLEAMSAATLRELVLDVALQADATAELVALQVAEGDERAAVKTLLDGVALPEPDKAHQRLEAKEARTEWATAQKAHRDAIASIGTAKEKVREAAEGDYGPDGVWLALRDECVSQLVSQYTYEVCFFGDVKQKDGRSGHAYRLGRFDAVEWDAGNARAIRYSRGDRCPAKARDARVELACGPENAIEEVDEPETCSYLIRMRSPAVCGPAPSPGAAHDGSEL